MLGMNIPKSVAVIRKVNGNNKSTILGLHDKNMKPFVIGFVNHDAAEYVQKHITSNPNCHLHRGIIHDVSRDVNVGLLEFGIVENITNLCIDVDARLTIMKKPKAGAFGEQSASDKLADALISTGMTIDTMDYGDFLMYPLEKMIGVVMPFEVIDEDDYKIEFNSQVIDSSDDINRMAQNLDKMFKL
jgi:hypothetical protein